MARLAKAAAALFLAVCARVATSQTLIHDEPVVLWGGVTLEGNTPEEGNALVLAPDESVLYVTTSQGVLYALDPVNDGTQLWRYPTSGTSAGCTSGVSFHPIDANEWAAAAATDAYIVYAVVTALDADGSPLTSQVIAVNKDGSFRWAKTVDGGVSGTPQATSTPSGYVFFTRNVGNLNGWFTVVQDTTDDVLFFNEELVGNTYGPVGIYHDPVEGYYAPINGPSGLGNSQDIAVWGNSLDTGGSIRGFQFSADFDGTPSNLTVVVFTGTSWFTEAAPTLGAEGRSLYFSGGGGGRGQMRVWYPYENFTDRELANGRLFHRNAFNDTVLEANTAERLAAPSSPVLSNGEFMVFQAGPRDVFYGLLWDLSIVWNNQHNSTIVSKPLVSQDDERVYYAESGSGNLYVADAMDGTIYFTRPGVNGVTADCALSSNGVHYCGDNTVGLITALTVSTEGSAPPSTPSPSPPTTASPGPTEAGTTEASPEPTEAGTTEASPEPTEAGTTEASTGPTEEGTTEASPGPTEAGTTEASPGPTEAGSTEASPGPTEAGTTTGPTEAATTSTPVSSAPTSSPAPSEATPPSTPVPTESTSTPTQSPSGSEPAQPTDDSSASGLGRVGLVSTAIALLCSTLLN